MPETSSPNTQPLHFLGSCHVVVSRKFNLIFPGLGGKYGNPYSTESMRLTKHGFAEIKKIGEGRGPRGFRGFGFRGFRGLGGSGVQGLRVSGFRGLGV